MTMGDIFCDNLWYIVHFGMNKKKINITYYKWFHTAEYNRKKHSFIALSDIRLDFNEN